MLETNIDRWEAWAIAKGVQQGMQRGEAFLLQRQLTRRFWRTVRRPAGQTCRRHASPVGNLG